MLRADRWGASREKLGEAPGQGGLFNEVEALVELAEALDTAPALTATPLRETRPVKGKPGRKAIAGHLPRIEIRHELPESERTCGCGTPLTEIAPEVSEQIDYAPARVQVLRHLRAKYVCPGCEQCVKTAPVAPQLLPKTNAAPGLLAAGHGQVCRQPAVASPGTDLRPPRHPPAAGDPGGVDDRTAHAADPAAEPDGRADPRVGLRAHRRDAAAGAEERAGGEYRALDVGAGGRCAGAAADPV
ncbi:MAG: IS66 family transposase zinc-finger binding domain-containing protein [Proteobacteria bacterium]|nr:IS66 family transposase zinc-finger binding domain-containing protein [Pseudomonadota bacterium]